VPHRIQEKRNKYTQHTLQKPKILKVFWNVMSHSLLGKYYLPNPAKYLASKKASLDEAVRLLTCIQSVQFESPPGHQLSWGFWVLFKSLQANARIELQNRPWMLPPTLYSIPYYYTSTNRSIDHSLNQSINQSIIWCHTLRVTLTLNKLKTQNSGVISQDTVTLTV